MAKELVALVDAGTIRLIDVLILTKDADGTVDAMELSDVEELGRAPADRDRAGRAVGSRRRREPGRGHGPGSTAGVLIWENLWAAPFASAARRSGGQLIADGRIPIQAIIASIEADDDNETRETDMPMRAARVGRVGVIGHPVAKTAVVAKAVTPGPAPIAKTAVVAAAVTPGRRRRRI